MPEAAVATQTATQTLELTPPEVLAPVAKEQVPDMVPLKEDTKQQVDAQVTKFVDALMTEDVHSDAFRNKLDSAFRLGREEISSAASLMSGRFMDRNFVGIEDSAAFKAIGQMRDKLDELNPGKEGDLFAPKKILGFIPFGNRLTEYFRKFQSAGNQLQSIMTDLYAARDDMGRDASDIEQTKQQLWDAMQKLKAAIHFAEQLDAAIAGKVEALRTTDPVRSKSLEQEVLFYARQNLADMQTQLAVNVNGYLSMDVLKKTAREMINGCNRVATTGMSALAVAQQVARATGNQIQVMNMLNGTNEVIGNIIVETSKQLGQHVERTGDFASNPLIGVQRIQEMFDNTFKAMDSMDNFRSKAIEAMGKNNQMLSEQIKRSEQYMDKNRGEQAREAMKGAAAIEGPVSL